MKTTDTFNEVTIIGYLAAAPTFQKLGQKDQAILSIWTRGKYLDHDTNQYKEKRNKHRVVVQNAGLINSVVQPLLGQGSHVMIKGELITRSWKDKATDNWKHITEVVLSGQKSVLTVISNNKA